MLGNSLYLQLYKHAYLHYALLQTDWYLMVLCSWWRRNHENSNLKLFMNNAVLILFLSSLTYMIRIPCLDLFYISKGRKSIKTALFIKSEWFPRPRGRYFFCYLPQIQPKFPHTIFKGKLYCHFSPNLNPELNALSVSYGTF